MRRLLLAVPFLAVAMYATNPGAETHRATITGHVYRDMPQAPSAGLDRGTIDGMIGRQFSYGDYELFSVGRVAGKPATVGILGQVIPARL